MAQKTGELKKRCWLAKQRLKMGYWESLKRDNGTVGENVSSLPSVPPSARAWILPAAEQPQDDKMYKRVCAMLDSNEITINPIGQLIEREIYDQMDDAARQRYVLELSEKFRELRDRYYREKTGA